MRIERTLSAIAFVLGLVRPILGENAPLHLASEARFDLYASPEVVRLDPVEAPSTGLWVSRPSWMKEAEQWRALSGTYWIRPSATNDAVLHFLPQRSGRVTLSLLGPFEPIGSQRDGNAAVSEVYWDWIEVDGATLNPESAALLQFPLRSWFRQRYDVGLQVKAGTPVTLHVWARPVIPTGYREPKVVESRDTVAHRTARHFQRGITLTVTPEMLKASDEVIAFPDSDFNAIRREGFDHVRVLVPWTFNARSSQPMVVNPEIFARVDLILARAAKQDLAVLLGFYGLENLPGKLGSEASVFTSIWEQVGKHYASFPVQLAFELASPSPGKGLNLSFALPVMDLVGRLRQMGIDQALFLPPPKTGSVWDLPRMDLPEKDWNLIVAVNSREPEPFTQQWWPTAPGRKAGITMRFPGPPEVGVSTEAKAGLDAAQREWMERYEHWPNELNPCNARLLRAQAEAAREWSEYYGRPVYFADWGCDARIDASSRARYYEAWRTVLRDQRVGWGAADWKQTCAYWDSANGRPLAGLREALFPSRSGPGSSADHSEWLQTTLQQLDDLKGQFIQKEQRSAEEIRSLRTRAQEVHQQSLKTQLWTRWLLVGVVGLALLVFAFVLYGRWFVRVPQGGDTMAMELAGSVPNLRQQVILQWAESMKEKAVQKLLADRRESRAVQNYAAEELEDLERRLAALQYPIQERLAAYEKRIEELEVELSRKGAENRELVRAKIEMTKQRMALVRSGALGEWG